MQYFAIICLKDLHIWNELQLLNHDVQKELVKKIVYLSSTTMSKACNRLTNLAVEKFW